MGMRGWEADDWSEGVHHLEKCENCEEDGICHCLTIVSADER